MTLCTAVAKGSSKRMQVPLSRPSITQADIAAVLEVLNSPSLSLGPKLSAFERAMAEYSGTAEAVAVNSGTSGLHVCLAAAGIKPGDEVITTPFSFVASANCALRLQARRFSCDRANRLDYPGSAVLHRHGRGAARLSVRAIGSPNQAVTGLASPRVGMKAPVESFV